MKTNNTLKVLLTALLLGTGLSGASAASLLADGDFDSLPVGTAPDVGTPAGHWFWPDELGVETDASQFSIVPAPAGGTGNCLQLSVTPTESIMNAMHMPNFLGRSVTKVSGEILHVSFDIYVEPGRGGSAVHLGKGYTAASDRGPQVYWLPNGALLSRGAGGVDTTLISPYPHGVWQTVRLEVDLARDSFNFYWSEKGQPVSVIRSNLTFRSGSVPYIDRFVIGRFPDNAELRDVHSYIDNIWVSAGEPAAVVPGQSFALPGGGLTLSLTNTLNVPSTYQWQFNGTNLPGANGPTLALSNVTTNQSGPYSAIVSNAFEVVTTASAMVEVVNQLMLTAQPQSTNTPTGSNVTFRVTALSPSPITYQWQFNGTNLADQTNSTLTLTNVQLAQDGPYTVVATDALRSVTSQPATLTVQLKPIIILASANNLTNVAGATITLGVAIEGRPPPFFYVWRSNSTVIRANFGTSATSDFLTTRTPEIAGISNTFRVEVTNLLGTTLTIFSNRVFFTNHTVADSDSDGLPDGYESAYGGTGGLLDPFGDEDGDRLNNLAEYRAGTNPTNAASVLKIDSISVGTGVTLQFEVVANRIYTLEHSPAPGLGPWISLNRWVPLPTNQMRTVLNPELALPRVYRPRVD